MICLICRESQFAAGFTDVTLARGELRLVVKRVPSQVCSNCGEALVAEAVAVRLLRAAEVISELGESERVYDYADIGLPGK